MDKYENWLAKLFGKINGAKRYAVTTSKNTARYSVSKADVLLNPEWIKHQNMHKAQYLRYGWFGFMWRYIYYNIRYGYFDNPLEIEARKAEL